MLFTHVTPSVHWYLAVIYEPGHTLEPPLLLSHPSNTRMTRKRKQKQERAEANVETAVLSEHVLAEVSLDRSGPTAQVTKGEPEADTSSVDVARTTTPSTIGNEEPHDVVITVSDNVSEPVSATSFETPIRDSSPDLTYPPSDSMDVDLDISVTGAVPNPTCKIAEALEPLTSKPSSGIPVGQFYGPMPMPEPGDVKPVAVVDNEDSGEDQQQEAEVDDMLAVTQSSPGDLPSQYVALQEVEISILIDFWTSSCQDLHLYP